jgi:hypothetical protein
MDLHLALEQCNFGAYYKMEGHDGIRTLLLHIDKGEYQMSKESEPGKTVWESFSGLPPAQQKEKCERVWGN